MKKSHTSNYVPRNSLFLLFLPILLVFPIFCLPGNVLDVDPVLFFYSKTCYECKKMKPILEQIQSENKDIKIEFYEIDEDQKIWVETCSNYGIPTWGVPRIFIGDKVFAGWFEYKGDLKYADYYCGYIGYRNQIILALELYFNISISIDENEESNRIQSPQADDEYCGC